MSILEDTLLLSNMRDFPITACHEHSLLLSNTVALSRVIPYH